MSAAQPPRLPGGGDPDALAVPPPSPTGDITEDEIELANLAGTVRLIRGGVELGDDRKYLIAALDHLERCLDRLSGQVGATERRLGWRPTEGA